jgi:Rrf2 family cysteine metabolism transcriptional repressor
MIELAAYGSKGPLMVRKIAEKQKISKKYLDIIFTSLKLAGLVRAIRGATGGFLLTRVPEEILVSEIVAALEGALAPVDCCQSPDICERSHACAAQQLWLRLETAIRETLEAVTLADLVKNQATLDSEPPFCPTRG